MQSLALSGYDSRDRCQTKVLTFLERLNHFTLIFLFDSFLVLRRPPFFLVIVVKMSSALYKRKTPIFPFSKLSSVNYSASNIF